MRSSSTGPVRRSPALVSNHDRNAALRAGRSRIHPSAAWHPSAFPFACGCIRAVAANGCSGFRSRTRVATRGPANPGTAAAHPARRRRRRRPGQDHRLVLGVGIEVGDIAGGEATERILVGAAQDLGDFAAAVAVRGHALARRDAQHQQRCRRWARARMKCRPGPIQRQRNPLYLLPKYGCSGVGRRSGSDRAPGCFPPRRRRGGGRLAVEALQDVRAQAFALRLGRSMHVLVLQQQAADPFPRATRAGTRRMPPGGWRRWPRLPARWRRPHGRARWPDRGGGAGSCLSPVRPAVAGRPCAGGISPFRAAFRVRMRSPGGSWLRNTTSAAGAPAPAAKASMRRCGCTCSA